MNLSRLERAKDELRELRRVRRNGKARCARAYDKYQEEQYDTFARCSKCDSVKWNEVSYTHNESLPSYKKWKHEQDLLDKSRSLAYDLSEYIYALKLVLKGMPKC
jgi:hypothetical protein